MALATVDIADAKIAAITKPANPTGIAWIVNSGTIWSVCEPGSNFSGCGTEVTEDGDAKDVGDGADQQAAGDLHRADAPHLLLRRGKHALDDWLVARLVNRELEQEAHQQDPHGGHGRVPGGQREVELVVDQPALDELVKAAGQRRDAETDHQHRRKKFQQPWNTSVQITAWNPPSDV